MEMTTTDALKQQLFKNWIKDGIQKYLAYRNAGNRKIEQIKKLAIIKKSANAHISQLQANPSKPVLQLAKEPNSCRRAHLFGVVYLYLYI